MNQKTLVKSLKGVLMAAAVCGIIIYGFVFPGVGRDIAADYPEWSKAFWPWLILLWSSAIPCYCVLGFGRKIEVNIGNDHSFCIENARLLKWICYTAWFDAVLSHLVLKAADLQEQSDLTI